MYAPFARPAYLPAALPISQLSVIVWPTTVDVVSAFVSAPYLPPCSSIHLYVMPRPSFRVVCGAFVAGHGCSMASSGRRRVDGV